MGKGIGIACEPDGDGISHVLPLTPNEPQQGCQDHCADHAAEKSCEHHRAGERCPNEGTPVQRAVAALVSALGRLATRSWPRVALALPVECIALASAPLRTALAAPSAGDRPRGFLAY